VLFRTISGKASAIPGFISGHREADINARAPDDLGEHENPQRTSNTRSGSRHTVTIPIMRLPYCLRTGSLLSTGTPAKRRTFLKPGDIKTS
jgi:hypothetical protein